MSAKFEVDLSGLAPESDHAGTFAERARIAAHSARVMGHDNAAHLCEAVAYWAEQAAQPEPEPKFKVGDLVQPNHLYARRGLGVVVEVLQADMVSLYDTTTGEVIGAYASLLRHHTPEDER